MSVGSEPLALGTRMPTWLLFLVPSAIWGTTWLVIKFQLGTVVPEVSVAYRFGFSSLILFVWCLARGIRLRMSGRAHASLMLLGLLQYSSNYVLIYWSEADLTSGVVAVVYVLTVAWNLGGARVFFGSPLSRSVAVGAALGIVGVTLVFLPEIAHMRAAPAQSRGLAFAVLSTLAASAGNLWSQRVYTRGMPIVPSTAWAMLYASIAVIIYCTVRGVPFSVDGSPAYLLSLSYLVVFGSVFAFIVFLKLIQRIGAGRAGYTAALIPVLAMAVSTVFERYHWSALALAGMVLVVAGNLLVLRRKEIAAAPTPAPFSSSKHPSRPPRG